MKLLREMIESLPETYCQIMKLRYGQHLSISEISDLLDISKSNAGSRLHRAVARLRKQIDAHLRGKAI